MDGFVLYPCGMRALMLQFLPPLVILGLLSGALCAKHRTDTFSTRGRS